MQPNIVAAASGAQHYADQTMRNDMFNRTLGGVVGGLGKWAEHKVEDKRSALLTKALGEMADNSLIGIDKLDPETQMAMRGKADNYKLLATLGSRLPAKEFGELYKSFMPQQEDPLKLANELRKANIAAKAKVDAAAIYGANKPKGLDLSGLVTTEDSDGVLGGIGKFLFGSHGSSAGNPMESQLLDFAGK